MPRGGKRSGAGRKAKPRIPTETKVGAERVLGKLGQKRGAKVLPTEDDLWLSLVLGQDLRIRLDAMKYLCDRRDGKPIQTVNHLHDKPIDVNVTHTLGERMMSAMAKAEKRLSDMNGKKK